MNSYICMYTVYVKCRYREIITTQYLCSTTITFIMSTSIYFFVKVTYLVAWAESAVLFDCWSNASHLYSLLLEESDRLGASIVYASTLQHYALISFGSYATAMFNKKFLNVTKKLLKIGSESVSVNNGC